MPHGTGQRQIDRIYGVDVYYSIADDTHVFAYEGEFTKEQVHTQREIVDFAHYFRDQVERRHHGLLRQGLTSNSSYANQMSSGAIGPNSLATAGYTQLIPTIYVDAESEQSTKPIPCSGVTLGEIIASRCWRIKGLFLTSTDQNATIWPPHEAIYGKVESKEMAQAYMLSRQRVTCSSTPRA